MSILDAAEVTLVDSVEEADAFLTWLSQRRPHLAIDTETIGLDWWTGDGFLRLVQFGDATGGYAIPVHRWRGLADIALSRLREARAATTWLNWKFDFHALEADGLPLPWIPGVQDVGAMSRLIDPLARHGLKQIGERTIGIEATYGEQLLKAEFDKTKTDWATIPYDNAVWWGYAVIDTMIGAISAERLEPALRPYAAAYEREMAVQAIMYRAERRGLRVDLGYTSELRARWWEEEEQLRRHLQEQGIENPNSNVQVAQVLKDIGWEPDEFTDTGEIKLDKAILAELEKHYPGIAGPLLRYKRLGKWRASYLDTFILKHDEDMHIHASINTSAARTGRMSVTGPAFQTLPRGPEIRNAIVPDDGFDIWTSDYDGMEMVMMTAFSLDPGMVQSIIDGEDLHTYCAQLAYNDPTIGKSDPRRSTAKNTNFSRIYGAGPAKIAQTAGVTEAEIRTYMNAFDRRFPGVAEFIKTVQRQGAERLANEGEAYVRTVGGRRLPCDPDKVYVLVNYLIQGSCADLFKDAIVRLDQAGFGDNILMPVHDELLFQFPEGDTDGPHEAARLMEDLTTYAVPFTVGTDGPLKRWGQKYE